MVSCRTLFALTAAAVVSGVSGKKVKSFDVDEIIVYTGDGGYWSPGTEFGEKYIHYRMGCADGSVISTGGQDVRYLPMEVYGQQQPYITEEFFNIFSPYFSGAYGGWRPLPVNLTDVGDVDTVIPYGADKTHEGCKEPAFIEILYLSTDGWELNGLTVSSGGKYMTFVPETAWPRLWAPFDDYDSVFLDLDDNFTDYYRASDALVRLWLVEACDAIVEVRTGDSGDWAPGERENLHYKLLSGGTDSPWSAISPARGPPPGVKKWEPAHRPLDDDLTRSVYGGWFARSDVDFRHLDDLKVDEPGLTTSVRDRVAWECPAAKPSAVELVYGPTQDGWEVTLFKVSLVPSLTKEKKAHGWQKAIFKTEYPKLFATWDTPKVVFLDYAADCSEGWAQTTNPNTYYKCDSDWYMRFALSGGGSSSSSSDDEGELSTTAVVFITLFVTLAVVAIAAVAAKFYFGGSLVGGPTRFSTGSLHIPLGSSPDDDKASGLMANGQSGLA